MNNTYRKLTSKERTAAIARFARKYSFFARTVRAVSDLRFRAYAEYREVVR